jgi:hypothetical protein
MKKKADSLETTYCLLNPLMRMGMNNNLCEKQGLEVCTEFFFPSQLKGINNSYIRSRTA